MAKMPRITEPDEDKVHYTGPSLIGNVTLCGLTDFIYHKQKGELTRKKVNCEGCKAVMRWVYMHDREAVDR